MLCLLVDLIVISLVDFSFISEVRIDCSEIFISCDICFLPIKT